VYRAVDQHGQVIDVYVWQRRDIASAGRFFAAALGVHGDPAEVITDRAPALVDVIEELFPAALHNTGRYENNRVESDHGRLKARLRPMRGLKSHRTASVVIRGHALIQNLRRGHDEPAVDAEPLFRLATAIDELTPTI
jgi:transposase, IS6 family